MTSIAANDEVDDDEEDLGYSQKRTGLGAPVALLNDVAQVSLTYVVICLSIGLSFGYDWIGVVLILQLLFCQKNK